MRKTNSSRSFGCCSGCLGKILLFLLIIGIVLYFGYQLLESSGLKQEVLQLLYPIRYETEVENYCEQYQLDKNLVYALIRTESRFDPYAVSSVGAKGLMQLKEETAIDCATDLHIANFTTDLLLQPETNVQLGCYYLHLLLKQYNGNIIHALAAYNGGIGNVNQWLKNDDYVNENKELVFIPFTETRNYVTKVQNAYKMYQDLYTP